MQRTPGQAGNPTGIGRFSYGKTRSHRLWRTSRVIDNCNLVQIIMSIRRGRWRRWSELHGTNFCFTDCSRGLNEPQLSLRSPYTSPSGASHRCGASGCLPLIVQVIAVLLDRRTLRPAQPELRLASRRDRYRGLLCSLRAPAMVLGRNAVTGNGSRRAPAAEVSTGIPSFFTNARRTGRRSSENSRTWLDFSDPDAFGQGAIEISSTDSTSRAFTSAWSRQWSDSCRPCRRQVH